MKTITIGWLYPDLMSTYGDRGNVQVLTKRVEWRSIAVKVSSIGLNSSEKELEQCDLIFMGGAQDRQQKIVSHDFEKGKAKTLSRLIEKGVPGLYICGAYQFLGNYYKEADGTTIPGLGIFDLYTEHPGENAERLIGNVAARVTLPNSQQLTLIGFENHGGRTYLGTKTAPFGTILKGYGNNGQDNTEGAQYKNSFGSYFHGPLLPKNPQLADYLIQTALELKYQEPFTLEPLDDTIEKKAHDVIVRRLNIGV